MYPYPFLHPFFFPEGYNGGNDQNGHLGMRSLRMELMRGKRQAGSSLVPWGLHGDSHQGSLDGLPLDCCTADKSDFISLKHCYFGLCYLQPKLKNLSGESLHNLYIKHMTCENGGGGTQSLACTQMACCSLIAPHNWMDQKIQMGLTQVSAHV